MQLKSVFLGTLAVGLGLSLISQNTSLLAQQPKETSAETKGQKVEGGSRAPNLPSGEVTNDPKATTPPPANKGGSSGRGGFYSALVRFDNRTPWKIQLLGNGRYLGIIAPYGDADVPATSGNMTLQAVAEFTDGIVYTWGPRGIFLSPGDAYVWRLSS
ncbi:MAG: hypothetical protein KME35_00250 [Aphanocapsa sp. GSE-SYN-MK-11-07L]|jgi:hypothetical protein|nr:hypothetical protein [Aphanocapsa sp. GSE-SYN-MK-11-07L]